GAGASATRSSLMRRLEGMAEAGSFSLTHTAPDRYAFYRKLAHHGRPKGARVSRPFVSDGRVHAGRGRPRDRVQRRRPDRADAPASAWPGQLHAGVVAHGERAPRAAPGG